MGLSVGGGRGTRVKAAKTRLDWVQRRRLIRCACACPCVLFAGRFVVCFEIHANRCTWPSRIITPRASGSPGWLKGINMLDYKCPGSPSTGFNVCGLIERHETECELREKEVRIFLKVVVGSGEEGLHVEETCKTSGIWMCYLYLVQGVFAVLIKW